MYVMKYSTRDQSYNHPSFHGKFVVLDYSSGGYPWAVGEELSNQVEIWHSLDKALDYQKSFPCLDIYKLEIALTKLNIKRR
jgi:hypothetical protein